MAYDGIMWLALHSIKSIKSTFSIRSGAQLSSQGGMDPAPDLIVEMPGVKPATSWSVVRHTDPRPMRRSQLKYDCYLLRIGFPTL